MINKHIIISACRNKKESTVLYNCLHTNKSYKFIDTIFEEHNSEGLSKIYNKYIEKYKNKYDYIHFIHDDVWIYDDVNSLDKTLNEFNYDISGVAGANQIEIKYPSLWHLMGKQLNGVVEHIQNKNRYISIFGSKLDKVVILDGVYLCIRTKNINNWRFNENFAFHHYDLASCIDAFKQDLTLGVCPIHIRHEPKFYIPTDDKNWIESDKKFLNLYGN